jgi:hypothetical protein
MPAILANSAADPAGAVTQRSFLGELDQVGHVVNLERWIDDENERHRGDERGERQVFCRIVGQRFVERRVDGERRHRHHDRVAVRRRFRDEVCGDDRAGARPILDHESLAEPLLQPLREQARQRVGAARRRERHDERDLVVGVGFGIRAGVLRVGGIDCQCGQGRGQQSAARQFCRRLTGPGGG